MSVIVTTLGLKWVLADLCANDQIWKFKKLLFELDLFQKNSNQFVFRLK